MTFNLLFLFALVFIDLFSKGLVSHYLNIETLTPLYGDFSLYYMKTFVGYSLDNDYINLPKILGETANIHLFQYLLSFFVIIVFSLVLKQKALNENNTPSFLARLTCLLLISGTLGNMINLFWCGYVIDFIRFTTITDFVIVFNIADVYLYVAQVVFLVTVLSLICEKIISLRKREIGFKN